MRYPDKPYEPTGLQHGLKLLSMALLHASQYGWNSEARGVPISAFFAIALRLVQDAIPGVLQELEV